MRRDASAQLGKSLGTRGWLVLRKCRRLRSWRCRSLNYGSERCIHFDVGITNLAELYTKHLKKDRICILKTAHVEFSQLVPEDAQENIVLTMHEVVGKK